MFNERFPSGSARFDVSAVAASEWVDALEEGVGIRLWGMVVAADDLISRAASWRSPTDMFVSYRFSSRWSNYRTEKSNMAGRSRKEAIRDTDKAEWQGFLEFRLDEGLLAELDDWKPTPKQIWDSVDGMIGAGFRLTLSYNPKTKLASCTIVDDDAKRKSGGWALSSGDDDGAAALKMGVFKHLKLGGDWSSLLGQPSRGGKRG